MSRRPIRPYAGVRLTRRGLRPYAGVSLRGGGCLLLPALLIAAPAVLGALAAWR